MKAPLGFAWVWSKTALAGDQVEGGDEVCPLVSHPLPCESGLVPFSEGHRFSQGS